MTTIITEAQSAISMVTEAVADSCRKLGSSDRRDLAHICSERILSAKGTQRMALIIVQAALDMLEDEQ